MTAAIATIDPAGKPAREIYALLVELIQPRPIALVSTVSNAGVRNLAPFSFFMVGGSSPPSLIYCPALTPEGAPKDTLRNVLENGEFVVNLVDRPMVEAMNKTSPSFPEHIDEWQVAGLTPMESTEVKPERVAESPVQLECRLFEIVSHGSGPNGTQYVIGEIVQLHVPQSMLDDGKVRPGSLRLVGRLGGLEYVDLETLEIFSMRRPKAEVGSSLEP